MRKIIFLLVLVTVPFFIFANSSCFGLHQSSCSQQPQIQNDRAYRITQRTDQAWTYATSAWTNMNKSNYFYVSDYLNSPDSIAIYGWMPDTGSYNLTGVYHLTYDDSGEHVTHIVLAMTYGTDVYVYQDITFSYSAEGYLTGYLLSAPGDDGFMEPMARMAIQYVSTSNFQIDSWEARNVDWVPQWSHTTFGWDTQGRITQETTQASLDSLTWMNEEQITREYLAGDTTTGIAFINNLSHQLPFIMISGVGGPFYGLQTHTETKSWNNNQWVNRNKQDFTYNGSNILIYDLTSKWQGGTWRNEAKNEYIYDASNNLIEAVNMIWSNSSSAWLNDHRYLYNWDNYTATEDEFIIPQIQSINAYPNPSTQASTITFDAKLTNNERGSLIVYNIKGQIVRSLEISAGNPMQKWNSKDEKDQPCAAGVYFYRLVTNKHSETRKLVILR